jgi:hypothetical protein
MTDTPTPEPLASDVVDELLSALVDDEFDAAALDLGMTPDEARARLAATPGVAARTRAIDEARAELASTPPLDALTRRRLVNRALPPVYEGRRNRTAQWLLSAAGVAAVIALVFALIALPGRGGGGDSASSGAQPGVEANRATSATSAPSASSADTAIDDERELQAYVAQARASDYAARATANSATTSPAQPGTAKDATNQSSSGEKRVDRFTALAAAPTCNATIAKALGLESARIAQTTGVMHAGKPAIVVIFTPAQGVLGFLYDPATCKVLISTYSK